jgi:Na+-driven multidrug efflux pump
MIGMVTGAVLNIALDPLFIFVFGWGVAGASAATAISKTISWIILMLPYWRGNTMLKIHIRRIRFNWPDIREVLTMGSASFFRNGLATLAAIVLNRIAVGYSESALAAISVANRITFLMTAACLGFGQGFQPVAGFSWGARRYDRVRESYRFSAWTCTLAISAVSALVAIFAKPILLLFTEADADLVRLGVFSLRFQCLAMPFHGYCIVVNMYCAGIGRPWGTTLLGMARQGICFFPILPFMVRFFGEWGVASVQGVADILVLALAVPIALRVSRDVRQRELAETSPLSCINT